jgi:hypothetical protein
MYCLLDVDVFQQVDEVEPHAVLGALSKKQIKGKKVCY